MEALELQLNPTPRAVAEARGAVTQRFGHLPPAALDDLRLLITELVSNAVLHSNLEPDELLCVRVSRDHDRLHAEVADGNGTGDIRPKPLSPSTPGGFGLHLVDELSDRWGVRHGRRTCVWFELTPREAPAGAQNAAETAGG